MIVGSRLVFRDVCLCEPHKRRLCILFLLRGGCSDAARSLACGPLLTLALALACRSLLACDLAAAFAQRSLLLNRSGRLAASFARLAWSACSWVAASAAAADSSSARFAAVGSGVPPCGGMASCRGRLIARLPFDAGDTGARDQPVGQWALQMLRSVPRPLQPFRRSRLLCARACETNKKNKRDRERDTMATVDARHTSAHVYFPFTLSSSAIFPGPSYTARLHPVT